MSAAPLTPSPAASPGPGQTSMVDSPLHRTATTVTDYWNDSCSIEELVYAIERGAVGATTNPTIVGRRTEEGDAPLARSHRGDHRAEPFLE